MRSALWLSAPPFLQASWFPDAVGRKFGARRSEQRSAVAGAHLKAPYVDDLTRCCTDDNGAKLALMPGTGEVASLSEPEGATARGARSRTPCARPPPSAARSHPARPRTPPQPC